MTEIEIKIRITQKKALLTKLEATGAVLKKKRFYEENTLYDFPSQKLFKKQSALRLREINKKCYLAFKGPPQKSRTFKIREEYEIEIKNEKNARKILKSLGLKEAFRYTKHRTIYQKNRVKICLDETTVGDYIELEGKRSDIVRLAEKLGYSRKDFIKKDYIQLITQRKQADYKQ